MSDKSQIQNGLRALLGLDSKGQQYCVVGTVDSVNATAKTCEVTVLNGDADLQGVRLIANSTAGGLLLLPTVGSVVVCSFLNDAVAYVSMYSAVDAIQLNGTTYRGLVRIIELVQKLNALETFANQVKTAEAAINAAAVSSPGTPVTNATLAAFLATISPTFITPTTITNLENTTVKHGNGT